MASAGLSGCAGSEETAAQTAGPISQAVADGMAICLPVVPGGDITFAGEALTNRGDAFATLDTVELVGAVDVELVDAFVLPIEEDTLLGVFADSPASVAGTRWEDRQSVADATLAPGEATNLVVWLLRTGPSSRLEQLAVTYRSGGETYRWTSITSLDAEESCFG